MFRSSTFTDPRVQWAVDFGNPVAAAVFVGFVVGKPIGILTFSWLAVRWGITMLPPELSWGLVAGGGLLAGIGFTFVLP